ncbi:hypothetical protein BDI4_450016 [Burkholderia diffusa]|nr:hypothetical protein BDI4_450016 [Burkholderia diffusa]
MYFIFPAFRTREAGRLIFDSLGLATHTICTTGPLKRTRAQRFPQASQYTEEKERFLISYAITTHQYVQARINQLRRRIIDQSAFIKS